MNNFYVYALVEPINNAPFYFGKGKEKRAYVHGRPGDKHNKDKCNIINILKSLELKHKIVFVAENLTSEDALKLEKFCINEWKSRFPHYKLTNKNSHTLGRTGMKNSKESNEKRSLSLKKYINSNQEAYDKRKLNLEKYFKEHGSPLKGKPSWNSGLVGTQKAWNKGKKIPYKPRKQKEHICPHCNKHGRGSNMITYHMDNCKYKSASLAA